MDDLEVKMAKQCKNAVPGTVARIIRDVASITLSCGGFGSFG